MDLSIDQVRLPAAALPATARTSTAAQIAQAQVEQISIRWRTSIGSIDLHTVSSAAAVGRRARSFGTAGNLLNPEHLRNLPVGDAHQYEWNNKEKRNNHNLVDLQRLIGPGGFAVGEVG